ncbi:unnamed protein product [Mortierella alpina]
MAKLMPNVRLQEQEVSKVSTARVSTQVALQLTRLESQASALPSLVLSKEPVAELKEPVVSNPSGSKRKQFDD